MCMSSSQRIDRLFLGDNQDDDSDDSSSKIPDAFEGLFSMAGNTNEKSIMSLGNPKVKRSAGEALKIIHRMLLDKE